MQAQIVSKLPEGDRWLYEVKWDGYRAIAIKNGDRVEIRSRNNKDLTSAYPAAAPVIRKLKAQTAIIDGEIVAVDSSGRPSFQALQHRSARTIIRSRTTPSTCCTLMGQTLRANRSRSGARYYRGC
jgi:bifunctional non-homologous end joining protein LigD